MKRLLLLVIIFSLSSSISVANLFPSQAISKAEQFISLIDKQEYQTAYLSSSELLRLSFPENEWIVDRTHSDKLLGHVLKRKLVTVKVRATYPGLPDGQYMVVYYEVQTKLKAKAAEVLLVARNVDRWEVCSYRLK